MGLYTPAKNQKDQKNGSCIEFMLMDRLETEDSELLYHACNTKNERINGYFVLQ